MNIETISKAGAGVEISSPETSAAKVVPIETAPMRETVKTTGNTAVGDQGENTSSQGKKEHQPSEATINDAVSTANRRMERTRCEYSYHEETNRVSIKVYNADTDEVIREIPPEKSLDMLQKLWEMAGILVDEKR